MTDNGMAGILNDMDRCNIELYGKAEMKCIHYCNVELCNIAGMKAMHCCDIERCCIEGVLL